MGSLRLSWDGPVLLTGGHDSSPCHLVVMVEMVVGSIALSYGTAL